MTNPIIAVLKQINEKRRAFYAGNHKDPHFPVEMSEDFIRGAVDPNGGHVRYNIFMEGGYEVVPGRLITFIAEQLDEQAAQQFTIDYAAFRASLTQVKRNELETKLYPAGRVYGMVG